MIHTIATGLKGHGSEIVLRPRVDSKMRLRDGYGPANTPWSKGIKCVPNHFSPHNFGRLQHSLSNQVYIQKSVVIALIEVYKNKV